MLGNLISAGTTLLGGLLGKSSADSARDLQREQIARNEALQREFAQNGIQWRVEDAKKAGIHPIYALGGSGATFTPSSANFTSDTSLANAFASAGQDVGRAIQATRSAPDRAIALEVTKTQLEGLQLDNDIKRTELASKLSRVGRPQVGPPMPMATVPGYDPVPLPRPDPRGPDVYQHKQKDTAKEMHWRGWSWKTDPHTSPAEQLEDRYGDDISKILSLPWVGSADLLYNNERKIEFYQDLMRRAWDHPRRELPARRGYNPLGIRQGRR